MPETVTEKVISVIGVVNEPTAAPKEEALQKQTSALEVRAAQMPVTSDDEYQSAAEFGKMLKAKANEVVDFFKPMKDAAYKSHKEICDREKAMLAPLAQAEKIVKQAMGGYAAEQERKRREAEVAARKAAEEEANRRLAEAIALEEQGKKAEATTAIEEAEIIDNAAGTLNVAVSTPKVKGVSTKRDWELVGIDAATVPISFSGIELRPVDKAAIMRLIRASKGSIKIPGVTYKEIASMSFSGR